MTKILHFDEYFIKKAIDIGNGIDPRVDLSKTNKSILRRIRPAFASYYRKLFNDNVIEQMISKNLLVETKILASDRDDDVVLEQPLINPVTYPHEWPKAMILDAADSCLALHDALFRQGHCLVDSHPWNTVFDSSPKWVDITSIQPFDGSIANGALRQFEITYLALLQLLDTELSSAARIASANAFHNFDVSPFVSEKKQGPQRLWRRIAGHICASQSSMLKTIRHEVEKTLRQRYPVFTPEEASQKVKKLQAKLAGVRSGASIGKWTNYSQAGLDKITPQEVASGDPLPEKLANKKFSAIYQALRERKGTNSSLLDLACNRGIYSLFGAMMGYRVTATDIDEGALEEVYSESTTYRLPVTIILNDWVVPVEAQGMVTNPFPSFHDRITSDVVMCLALMHHLCLGEYHLSFSNLAKLLARACRNFLILEFVPPGDEHLLSNYANSFSLEDYSAPLLRQALEPYFTFERSQPSYPEGRELWFLQRKPS